MVQNRTLIIETYSPEGQLVETREVESLIGQAMPNFTQFIAQMMSMDSYYQLVGNTQNRDFIARAETGITRLEIKNPNFTLLDLQLLKGTWDAIIAGIPPDILQEIDSTPFNDLAISCNIPFRFADNFELIIIDAQVL